jgi:hypothetical protein
MLCFVGVHWDGNTGMLIGICNNGSWGVLFWNSIYGVFGEEILNVSVELLNGNM